MALVFGASSGIGRAFCHALSDRGFDVMCIARRETLLASLCSEIRQKGGQCSKLACDVSDIDQIDAVFNAINQRQLGVVVYSSGVCNQVPNYIEDISP